MRRTRSMQQPSGAVHFVGPLSSLLTLAVTACLAGPALAQATDDTQATGQPAAQAEGKDNQEAPRTLDRIVVVGSRKPEAISQIPSSVYYLDTESIQSRTQGGETLQQVLGSLVPSMDVGNQTRTNAFQNLQGREAQVMINGVSLMSTRDIHRQLDSIDPFNIDHIVVLSGATSIYGAGAAGGIINIVTKKGQSGPLGFTLQGALGTRGKSEIGNRKVAGSLQGGSDRVSGRLAFAWSENEGFYAPDGEQIFIDISQTSIQYNETRDLMGSVTFDLGSAGSLQLLAQHYDSNRRDTGNGLYLGPNLAGLLGHPDLLEMRGPLQLGGWTPGTKRNLFTADWSAPELIWGQDLLVQAFYRSEDLNYYPFPAFVPVQIVGMPGPVTVPFYGSSSQNTSLKGVKTALIANLGDKATLTYGIDYAREQFDATETLFDTATAFGSGGLTFDTVGKVGRYPGFKTRQLAAYAQLSWDVTPDVKLTAGLRGQHIDFDVDDFVGNYQQMLISAGLATSAEVIPGGSNDYSALLPNIGLVWSLNGNHQFFANYSVGFNVPDPAKYYGVGDYTLTAPGGSLILGNSTNVNTSPLNAIKTDGVQAGFRGHTGNLDYNVAAYYARSDRTFEIVPVVLNVIQLDQPVRTLGIQGKASYAITPAWRIGVSGNWVQTKDKVDGAWQDSSVSSASPSKLISSVTFAPPGRIYSATLQVTSIYDLDDADGEELQGYTTADLYGSLRFDHWQVNAGIQNLFNKTYQTVWSQRQQIFAGAVLAPAVYFQGMGRSYMITVTADF